MAAAEELKDKTSLFLSRPGHGPDGDRWSIGLPQCLSGIV